MRLFVSVDVDALSQGIAEAQERLADASGLSFTDPSQAHVTLKFLDDQPAAAVPDLAAAIGRAVESTAVPPFEARLCGLGVFPSPDYIRVVWLGVREGADELTTLHESVESELVTAGLDPADHAFTPHVTLARMDHAGGKDVVQAALEDEGPDVGSTLVEEVRLTKSTRTSEGPVYETVERFPLA